MPTRDSSLGLIVGRRPYERRVARADIDLALAAAAMDLGIRIYFTGSSVLQLTTERDPGRALLPPGYRAWAALPDLAQTRVFAETEWLVYCSGAGLELLMPIEPLGPQEMRRDWRDCRHVMVI